MERENETAFLFEENLKKSPKENLKQAKSFSSEISS
jgi:hypothetical protein